MSKNQISNVSLKIYLSIQVIIFFNIASSENCAELSLTSLTTKTGSNSVFSCDVNAGGVSLTFGEIGGAISDDAYAVGLLSSTNCQSVPSYDEYQELLNQRKAVSVCSEKCASQKQYSAGIDTGLELDLICIVIYCRNSLYDCTSKISLQWYKEPDLVVDKDNFVNVGESLVPGVKIINISESTVTQYAPGGDSSQETSGSSGSSSCGFITEMKCKNQSGESKSCQCSDLLFDTGSSAVMTVSVNEPFKTRDAGAFTVGLSFSVNGKNVSTQTRQVATVNASFNRVAFLAVIVEIGLGGFIVFKIRDKYQVTTSQKVIMKNEAKILQSDTIE